MGPWVDHLADDLQSMSFNSTTTATDTNRSTSSSSSSHHHLLPPFPTITSKPHAPSGDPCWDAIQCARSDSGHLSFSDLRFLRRIGAGDIGSVYLSELKSSPSGDTNALFAAKVMDKKELTSRNKEGRARTEREILEMLDHPFLPTLYATLDSHKWSCLLTEFCPGGDLHVLRQRQPCKRFPESSVRCAR